MGHCGCPTAPVEELPPLISEPCSDCSPYPYVLPCDFSSANQKHWIVDAAWKDGNILLWNLDTDAFHALTAENDDNPNEVVGQEEIHIDGCGCPPVIRRIEPVGGVVCPAHHHQDIIPLSLSCPVVTGSELAILPFAILPDSLSCEVCSLPPIIKEIA